MKGMTTRLWPRFYVGAFTFYFLCLFSLVFPRHTFAQTTLAPVSAGNLTKITRLAADRLPLPLRFAYSLGHLLYDTTTTVTFAFTYDSNPFPAANTITLVTDKFGHAQTIMPKGVYEFRPIPTQNLDLFSLSTVTIAHPPDQSTLTVYLGTLPGNGRVIQKATKNYALLHPNKLFAQIKLPFQRLNSLNTALKLIQPRSRERILAGLNSPPSVLGETTDDTEPPPADEAGQIYTNLQLFIDSNRNGLKDANEPDYSQPGIKIQLHKADQDLTYHLLEGWNFIHFPYLPSTFSTAAELVKEIATSGGYVTTVATWNKGKWQEYVQRGNNFFSPDFPITPGQAYFLRSHEVMDWLVPGIPQESRPIKLYPGFNGVGFTKPPSDLTAQKIIDLANKKSTEIDWWRSGSWEVFVKRYYSSDDIQSYGTDFPINNQRGYMIKAQHRTTIKL